MITALAAYFAYRDASAAETAVRSRALSAVRNQIQLEFRMRLSREATAGEIEERIQQAVDAAASEAFARTVIVCIAGALVFAYGILFFLILEYPLHCALTAILLVSSYQGLHYALTRERPSLGIWVVVLALFFAIRAAAEIRKLRSERAYCPDP